MSKRKILYPIITLYLALLVLACSSVLTLQSKKSTTPQSKPTAKVVATSTSSDHTTDIAIAVKAAAAKDCGCGTCAAKGCDPCHGKNCYFCVAKALVATDCSCKECDAKGCLSCGPGCDVCKFHLHPVTQAKAVNRG